MRPTTRKLPPPRTQMKLLTRFLASTCPPVLKLCSRVIPPASSLWPTAAPIKYLFRPHGTQRYTFIILITRLSLIPSSIFPPNLFRSPLHQRSSSSPWPPVTFTYTNSKRWLRDHQNPTTSPLDLNCLRLSLGNVGKVL